MVNSTVPQFDWFDMTYNVYFVASYGWVARIVGLTVGEEIA
ncbi:hypothetical protein [Providencia huaxiensis]